EPPCQAHRLSIYPPAQCPSSFDPYSRRRRRERAAAMSATATGTVSLWALLAEHDRLQAIWRNSRHESDRLAMAGAWALAITHPGSGLFDDGEPLAGRWERCTATVLCSDHWPEREHLHYRGACLGCGWVSDHTHRGAGAENVAV